MPAFFGIWLYYSNPMDLASFQGRISIVDDQGVPVEIESIRESGVWIYFAAKLAISTPYTVRIAEGVRNRVGRTASAYEFSFTTGVPGPPTPARIPTWLSLAAPGSFTTFAADREQRLFYHAQGLSAVRFSLYRLNDSEVETLLGRGFVDSTIYSSPYYWFWPEAKPMRQWTQEIEEEDRKSSRRYSTDLSSAGDPLPIGHYFLSADSSTGHVDDEEDFQLKLIVSVVDTAVITKLSHDKLLVWTLDHATGEPLDGVPITATRQDHDTSTPFDLLDTVTDADGLARFTTTPSRPYRNRGYGAYFVHVGGDTRLGVGSTRRDLGTSPGQLGVPASGYSPGPKGQLYTDRPIYRAGEIVYYKGVVRDENDARYFIPGDEPPIAITIRGPEYETLLSTTVQINDLGTFSGQLTLSDDAPTGVYSLWLSSIERNQFAFARFTVSQFRVPEFEVDLETANTDFIAGDSIPTESEASFFFGSPAADVDVSWERSCSADHHPSPRLLGI